MNITVTNAQLTEGPDDNHWMIALSVVGDSGPPKNVAMLLPQESLETLAAEYGFDPTDVDTLLDLAIWLPYAGTPIDHQDPNFLYNAATVDDARNHLVARVEAVRKGKKATSGGKGKPALKAAGPSLTVLVDSDGADPLDTIKQNSPMRPDVIAAKAHLVNAERGRHAEKQKKLKETRRETPGERIVRQVRDMRAAEAAQTRPGGH